MGLAAKSRVGQTKGLSGYETNKCASPNLYLVRLRCFSSLEGAWLSRDPAEYLAGTSLYAYSARPFVEVDPSGALPQVVAGCLAGGAGGFAGGLIGSWTWRGALCGAFAGATTGCCISALPPAGCICGAFGGLVENVCLALGGPDGLGDITVCELTNMLIDAALGCLGGRAAEVGDAQLDWILGFLGLNSAAWGQLCIPAVNVLSDHDPVLLDYYPPGFG